MSSSSSSYEDYEQVSVASADPLRWNTTTFCVSSSGTHLGPTSRFPSSTQQEYKAYLSRIRSFLAGTRSRSTLMESERLLADAKKAATAMQGLAEVEGNPMRVTEAKNLIVSAVIDNDLVRCDDVEFSPVTC